MNLAALETPYFKGSFQQGSLVLAIWLREKPLATRVKFYR